MGDYPRDLVGYGQAVPNAAGRVVRVACSSS